ncbi:FkbM family methyltransferase [Sulfitobacter sabulilitoris]|nr:FkbM family methyltransferase [Sulfitobacter sabulilitoris]
MTLQTDIEADTGSALDAKVREIWSRFQKPWVRKILRDTLPPTRITSMGCEFIVHPRDNFTEFKIWETGLPPEHAATLHIAGVLAGQDAVIVDVGANAGAFFLPIMQRAGKKARAIAFEPNPVMRDRLAVNVKLNKLTGVRVFDCAVGAEEASTRLHFPRNGNLGQGRVDLEYTDGNADTAIDVAVRPLADCLKQARIKTVDFLKVDVEGLEDRVICPLLEGDEALWPRMIYFEVAHDGTWSMPLLEMLEERGYTAVGSFDNNSLFERS